MTDTATKAPRVTATALRTVLAGDADAALLVWAPAAGVTEPAPEGLTAAQAESPHLVPVLTWDQALAYLTAAAGDAKAAAAAATAELRDQLAAGWL